VAALLGSLGRERRLTVITATHDPLLYNAADRQLLLSNGRLTEMGAPAA
jgi:predicted ABC-type transport system involved in lysophospholipase L1 biosynthesis ATPase subunit